MARKTTPRTGLEPDTTPEPAPSSKPAAPKRARKPAVAAQAEPESRVNPDDREPRDGMRYWWPDYDAEKECDITKGRPSKFTPEVAEAIIGAIEDGNYVNSAVRAAGIATTTYRRWMEWGETDPPKHEVFRLFRERVKKGKHSATVDAIACIRKAMRTQWTAAAWYLERKMPDIWAAIEKRPGRKDGGNTYAAAPAPDPDAPDVEPSPVRAEGDAEPDKAADAPQGDG